MKLFVSTVHHALTKLNSYLVITSLYHVHWNVALEDVIVAQDNGEVILIQAGFSTSKSTYLQVITELSERNIVTSNLYLQDDKSVNVTLHVFENDSHE
ncbi:hypothetical protein IKI14_00010 [bacterium]|nr:hypothetical protein [bacterium]